MAMFVVPCWSLHCALSGAVSALGSKFGFGCECLEVPSFDEMILSRGWRFLDAPSLLDVGPSPVSLVEGWLSMAARSLPQFGIPVTPSFLGDFRCSGYFLFDSKGLLWSFMVPVVVAAALLAAAGRNVFVWRDAMLAALIVFFCSFLVLDSATIGA